ncbi:hypothetical protein [Nitrosomonas sp.]|uniref:hypothetical protein n=1 Tax=Nitrosomonas sp. TaxID=42353 RepID=UPI0026252C89|nr:hypothetical protein [Nitrosomonas sp.]
MNIKEYLTKLEKETHEIFIKSLKCQSKLGKVHHLSSCIYEFTDHIYDQSEKNILITVSSQLESATLNATMGMYRQAFSSLRLAFEMGLGAAHFSVHKLDLIEWLNGRADIKWSELINEDNGVLSSRFTNAFFKELSSEAAEYRGKAISTYRNLSEFVHGNNETWEKSGLQLSYNKKLLETYFETFSDTVEIILFVLTCRYAKSLSKESLESLQCIPEEFVHILHIREIFGGPKV